MKIIQYQNGGGVQYQPWIGKIAASPSAETPENKDSVLDEEVIELMSENGLNSDHAVFMNKLKSIYADGDLYSSFFGSSKQSQFIKLMSAHSMANAMAYNKSLSDSAWERINSTNAGNDVAMSTSGRLYVMTSDGNLKTISPEAYYKNKESYQVLTNIELLNYRNENPTAAFNTTILPDLQNIISISSIVDDLLDTISKFDKVEYETKSQNLSVYEKGKIKNGFDAIMEGGAEGVYKITQHVKSSHEGYSNDKEYMEAITYLWSTLDKSQKKAIIAHTAAEGMDPTKVENVYSILAMALVKHTAHSTSSETSIDYDETASKNAGLGVVGKKEQMVQLTYLEQVANGRTTADEWIDIRSNTGISNITFLGNPYPVLDFSDKAVKTQSLSSMLTEAQVGQIVDQSSISFGNRVVGTSEMDKIIYDSNSPMYRVHLPYDEGYYNATGKYKPDLDAQKKFDEFTRWLKESDRSQPMINQKIKELGLNLNMVKDGMGQIHYVFKNSKEFIMMTGVSSHRAVDIGDSWKGKLSDNDASYFYDFLESNTSYEENWWRHFYGDAASTYKSAIFMPIIDSAMATVATSGEFVDRSAKTDIQQRVRYNERSGQIISNF